MRKAIYQARVAWYSFPWYRRWIAWILAQLLFLPAFFLAVGVFGILWDTGGNAAGLVVIGGPIVAAFFAAWAFTLVLPLAGRPRRPPITHPKKPWAFTVSAGDPLPPPAP